MPSFSIPLSGLTAASDQLQSVSNNLANLNTGGFKSQTVSFADLIVQAGITNGSGDPLQTGSGVKPATTDSNFTEGSVNPTGIASNMAIAGNGFFITQNSNVTTGVATAGSPPDYTRAGDFTTNTAGFLTAPSGELVQGYPAPSANPVVVDTTQPLQSLKILLGMGNPTTPLDATDTLKSFTIQADGIIEGSFSSGATVPLGQVAVATFANIQGLAKVGNSNYLPTKSSGPASLPAAGNDVAGTGGRGTIVGGSVEASNVDLATEFSKMIVAQQYYSANAKTITTFNQVSQATIAMLQ